MRVFLDRGPKGPSPRWPFPAENSKGSSLEQPRGKGGDPGSFGDQGSLPVHGDGPERHREVYGITGNKGHGKDTFARLVQEECLNQAREGGALRPTFEVAHFADALKQISARIFGLTEDQMHDPAKKEEPLNAPLRLDLFVEAMQNETGLPIQPAGKVATTPREVMQFFGTEYVRRAQDDYWIQRLLRDTSSQRRLLVPDTRFPNEAEALRSVGGKIIKIVRIDAPISTDGHASEKEMASIEPDLLLGVRTGDLSLPRRVATLLAQGKFEAATRYDYRTGQGKLPDFVPQAGPMDTSG